MSLPAPRHILQLVLAIVLLGLIYQQLLLYNSEPLLTTTSRSRGRHPRLTICPFVTAPPHLMASAFHRLVNRSISVAQFYDTVTIKLLGEALTVYERNRLAYSSDTHGPGVWKEKFYWRYELRYTRCVTFHPRQPSEIAEERRHPLVISLQESPLFSDLDYDRDFSAKKIAYRLFVHGDDVPNVGDLPHWVPNTENTVLIPGQSRHFVISARRTERVDLRRRPCSSRPGYSKTQCLKECQWRRLAARAGCRLPHMVGAETFLPEMGGFMDYLPFCSRMMRKESDPQVKWFDHGLPRSECMESSKEFNLTRLDEDYLAYRSQTATRKRQMATSPPGRNVLVGDTCAQLASSVATSPSWGASTPTSFTSKSLTSPKSGVSPPPPPPPTIPPPWTSESILLPAAAFLFIPDEVFAINLTDCQCPDACKETTYSLMTEENLEKDGWNPCMVFLKLTFDFTEEVILESLGTTLNDFLSSMASFIGLFTGFSLFTFAVWIESSLRTLRGKLRKSSRRAGPEGIQKTFVPDKVVRISIA